jgi:hypothetical protein
MPNFFGCAGRLGKAVTIVPVIKQGDGSIVNCSKFSVAVQVWAGGQLRTVKILVLPVRHPSH